jgi:hypothetical protein
MGRRGALLLFGSLLLLAVPAIAATSKGRDDLGALIEKGRSLSDIWAKDSPPFRMEAKFQLLRPHEQPVQGSYLQIWAPPGSSREEITLPGYQEIVVRNGDKAYYKPAQESQAFAAFLVRRTVNLHSHPSVRPSWKTKGVKFQKEEGIQVKCVSAGNEIEGFDMLCLDPAREYVLFEYAPTMAFSYSGYSKFGSRFFPGTLVAKLGGDIKMEVEIERLVEDASTDLRLFEPPPGAQVSAWCEDPAPAQMVGAGLRMVPGDRTPRERTNVEAWAVVGMDGRLHNPTIVRTSGARHVDMADLEKELSGLRFRPAACGTSPVETWISVVTMVAQ